MPTPTNRNTAAGNRNHFLFFTDDDGVILGSSPTRPAAGTGSGCLRIWAVKRAAATVPNPDVVIDEGDDGEILTEYMFRSIASRGFVVEVAVQDLAAAAVLQNVPVRIVGRGQFVVVDTSTSPTFNVGAILQSRAINVANGAQEWSGVVIPRGTATYLGRAEFNDRTPGVFRFFITPVPAGWSPLGYTYVDSNGNPITSFYDEFRGYGNPITMHAFTGDGNVAAIPVDYPPVSVVASVLAITPPSGQGSTAAAITSVSSAVPYTITATVAPGVDTRSGLLYEYSS